MIKDNITNTEIIISSFDEIKTQFDLQFLPDYLAEIYSGKLLVFKDDAYFDVLDLDRLAQYPSGSRYTVLFEKDLIVEGLLSQPETEFGPLIIVKGNTQAKNLLVGGGDIYLLGNAIIRQTIFAIYNHGTLSIDGMIDAELVINSDHYFDIKYANVQKGILFGFNRDYDFDINGEYNIKNVLKNTFYDHFDQNINNESIKKAMNNGQSLLRDDILTVLQKRILKFKQSKNKRLDLSYLSLERLPEEVIRLEGVEQLDLSGNYLTTLPDELLKWATLRKIKLSNCEFTQFPYLLLQIATLEDIDLSENPINTLSDDLIKLRNLKKLRLANCCFIKIPGILYSLENLQELDLSFQKGRPELIVNQTWKKLRVLDLSDNLGASLSAVQPKLEKLSMSNCSLKEFPYCVIQSPQLKHLDITLNKNISQLPVEITELVKLNSLCLPLLNMATDSIALLATLPKLTKITVEFRDQTSPPQINDILMLPNWTELYFDGYLEDQFIIKDILQRPNLVKIEKINANEDEKIDIKRARVRFGIQL